MMWIPFHYKPKTTTKMKTLLLLTVVAVVASHRVQHGSRGLGRTHGGIPRPGGSVHSQGGNSRTPDNDRIVYPDSDSYQGLGLPVRPGRPGAGSRPVRPGTGLAAGGQGDGAVLGPIGGGPDGVLSLLQCKPYIRPQVHFELGRSEYHFSWCSDGGRKYVWEDANGYCEKLGSGWGGVSIETEEENQYITNIIDQHRLPYIWTSGNRLHAPYKTNLYNWLWAATGNQATYYNWGQTGMVPGRPQPDNNENDNEQCLSVINRFYPGDGITWHDIGCHHMKPIICERQTSKKYYE
ncbi:uncharacterized protein [Panulirus ornatus]|uniref:uncharacterized protein isoform X2 n=1 Tax=Panulirus ornatus TaxID=150431 RepID=UPI003A885669